jgi:hypothetical protein
MELEFRPRPGRALLRQIWTAPDRKSADAAIALFAEKYQAKYDKAVACLMKHRDLLLTFYNFPAEPGITCGRRTRSRVCSPRSGTGRCVHGVLCRRTRHG